MEIAVYEAPEPLIGAVLLGSRCVGWTHHALYAADAPGLLREPELLGAPCHGVMALPDGGFVARYGESGLLRRWPADGPPASIRAHDAPISTWTGPTPERPEAPLVTGDRAGEVQVRATDPGLTLTAALETGDGRRVLSLERTSEGLVIARGELEIIAWDSLSEAVVWRVRQVGRHPKLVLDLQERPIVFDEESIRLLDDDGHALGEWRGRSDLVGIHPLPDGRWLLHALRGLSTLDPRTGERQAIPTRLRRNNCALRHPEGWWITWCTERRATRPPQIEIVRAADGRVQGLDLYGPARLVQPLSEGRIAVVPAGRDPGQVIRIFDLETGREPERLRGHPRAVRGMKTLPDGRLLSWCQEVRVWEI